MLQLLIRCGRKLSFPRNSRSLQSSTVSHDRKKGINPIKDEFDEDYWHTESEQEHPFARTFRVMSKQMRELRNKVFFWREPLPVRKNDWTIDSADFPSHVDVLIIGSGAIADSAAYWIKASTGKDFTTVVIESGDKYTTTVPTLHGSGLRLQHTLDENIEMALFSRNFIREAHENLFIDDKPMIKVPFYHQGFLNLATEAGAEQLEFNAKNQKELGIKNVVLTAEKLKEKFPWMNTDGIALGCLGLEGEGWFDPYILSEVMKRKALELGAEYVTGEVKGFIFAKSPNRDISSPSKADLYQQLNHAVVKTIDGEKKVVQFAILVIAAGHESAKIAKMLRIGQHTGILSVPLPLESRKRYLYTVHVPNGPGINTPITQDPSGFFFRRDGLADYYTVGFTPHCPEDEIYEGDLDLNTYHFDDVVFSEIANRIPSFEKAKVKKSQAAFLDYNRFDESGIIGPHPLYNNAIFATGFGYNSVSFSPAIGKAVSELVADARFSTLDLTRFGFDRFITLEPQKEARIL